MSKEIEEFANKLHAPAYVRLELMKKFEDCENIAKDYNWSVRESYDCDFLTERERCVYAKALFNAMRWGRVVKQQ